MQTLGRAFFADSRRMLLTALPLMGCLLITLVGGGNASAQQPGPFGPQPPPAGQRAPPEPRGACARQPPPGGQPGAHPPPGGQPAPFGPQPPPGGQPGFGPGG